MKKQKNKKQPHKHFYQKKAFLWPVGSFFAIIVFVLVLFRVTPWPGAMIIRTVFDKNGAKVLTALQAHTTTVPVGVLQNQQYRPGDKDALADVYFPGSAVRANSRLPVVVWTH